MSIPRLPSIKNKTKYIKIIQIFAINIYDAAPDFRLSAMQWQNEIG
jgi:hypothetical protein